MERCPDCRLINGHDEECHVLWAENLREMPESSVRRNPFLEIIKSATSEQPIISSNKSKE